MQELFYKGYNNPFDINICVKFVMLFIFTGMHTRASEGFFQQGPVVVKFHFTNFETKIKQFFY